MQAQRLIRRLPSVCISMKNESAWRLCVGKNRKERLIQESVVWNHKSPRRRLDAVWLTVSVKKDSGSVVAVFFRASLVITMYVLCIYIYIYIFLFF